MKEKREYVMRARADAVEETRRRMLAAAQEVGRETMSLDIALRDVAERAEVSVQTVLRHFGSREGLLSATLEFVQADLLRKRGRLEPTDPAAGIAALVDEYEDSGDWVITMLGQESAHPQVRRMTETGRAMHRRWVRTVLHPEPRDPERAEEIVDLLVVATDVYTWKLLRRDRGLTRAETLNRIRALVAAVLA
jgi:AcrR family transcriptional regulator